MNETRQLDMKQLEQQCKDYKEKLAEKAKLDGQEKELEAEKERHRQSIITLGIADDDDTFDVAVQKLNDKITKTKEEILSLNDSIQKKIGI